MIVPGRDWRGTGGLGTGGLVAARCALALALVLAPLAASGLAPGTAPGAALAARPGQVPAAEATGWRLGEHDAAQRLVVDLTRPIDFKIFTLTEPFRVVIDMPEIDWRRLERDEPLQNGVVTRVRYGVLKPGTSRLVVDTAMPLK